MGASLLIYARLAHGHGYHTWDEGAGRRVSESPVDELRKDPTRGHWVLIRPKGKPPLTGECPYCPGAEHLTAPEIAAYRKDGSAPNAPGWSVRVVPEGDAYFRIEWDLVREGVGMFDMITPRGASELILESTRHEDTLATMSPDALETVLWMYRDRLVDLKRDGQIRDILVSRRHKKPGVSTHHPYSRVTAIPIVFDETRRELCEARASSRACSPSTFARSRRPSTTRASRWCSTRRRTSGRASCRGTGRRSATTITGTSRSSRSPSARTASAESSSTRRHRRSPRR